jgi:excisionase family DNA binding protein
VRRRRPNGRLIKIHRTYTVEEAALTLGVHRNTIRTWIKDRLPTVDRRRPLLILGRDLRAYLDGKGRKRKQPCQPGELYCVRCRSPKPPAGGMLEYVPLTRCIGNLRGLCPDCCTLIHRRVSFGKLGTFEAIPGVTITVAARNTKWESCALPELCFEGA